MVQVAHLGRDDLGPVGAGVEEDLVELVRADVHQDAAILRPLKKPGRARCQLGTVRREDGHLEHLADGAGPDQLARLHGRAHVEALAEVHRVDAPRLSLDAAHLRQLGEGRHAGLVGHVVLAVLHGADAQRRPLARDAGVDDQLDARILQDRLGAGGARPPGDIAGHTPRPTPVRWQSTKPTARRHPAGCRFACRCGRGSGRWRQNARVVVLT